MAQNTSKSSERLKPKEIPTFLEDVGLIKVVLKFPLISSTSPKNDGSSSVYHFKVGLVFIYEIICLATVADNSVRHQYAICLDRRKSVGCAQICMVVEYWQALCIICTKTKTSISNVSPKS